MQKNTKQCDDCYYGNYNSILNTISEIEAALQTLKPRRRPGPDGILPEFFNWYFSSYLRSLFNCIFKSGNFPDLWSRSIIFPLHNKGNIHDVNNYRGISLMDICGKVFTSVLNNRLKYFIGEFGKNVYLQLFYSRYSIHN